MRDLKDKWSIVDWFKVDSFMMVLENIFVLLTALGSGLQRIFTINEWIRVENSDWLIFTQNYQVWTIIDLIGLNVIFRIGYLINLLGERLIGFLEGQRLYFIGKIAKLVNPYLMSMYWFS